MLTFNTNLNSLFVQRSLRNSTNILNQAIERMSTGMQINHAKDNPANFVISEMITTQLSSLDIAEDNASSGLDLLSTANETLDLINSRFTRLRDLAMQAENKTYGEESLKAINKECQNLVAEIKRLYKEAEFNGLKIYGAEFQETIPVDGTQTFNATPTPQATSSYATEETTLQLLGIGSSSFQIYNSEGSLIESYDTDKTDTIGDVFDVLETYGFTCSITDGVISISSTNGRYVDGELMELFGINLDATDFVSSSSQNSDEMLYYTATLTATEATTFGELGVLSGTDVITVKDKYGDVLTEIEVNSNTTLGGLFNALEPHGIMGYTEDGVITFDSSRGNYLVSEGVIANLGIGTYEGSNVVTTGTTQTSGGVVTYESVTSTGGEVITVQQEITTTIWTTTTASETVTTTIWTTTTTSQTVTGTVWITTTSSTTETETIWTTTTTSETFTETIWTTTTASETVTNTIWTTTTTSQTLTETGTVLVTTYTAQTEALTVGSAGGFINSVTRRNTNAMTALSSKSSNAELSSGTYKISTTAELQQLATLTNNGYLSSSNTYEFVLAGNIDLSSISNWTAIGNDDSEFASTFDGNGYVISNLTINSTSDSHGLFGCASGSDIKNLGLENVNVSGGSCVGGLVGYTFEGDINNCYVIGTVSGIDGVGGLGGNINNATDCYFSGDVNGTGDCVGGLAGMAIFTTEDCSAFGTVSGSCYVGGLVGSGNCIYYCGFSGTVSGDDEVGGLAGDSYGDVWHSYALADVSGTTNVGGLIGGADIDEVFVCYSKGTVIGASGPESVTNSDDWYGEEFTYDVPIASASATLDTTLGELGVTANQNLVLPNSTVTMSSTMTMQQFINKIKKDSAVTNAQLVNGILTITTTNDALDLSTGFLNEHNATQTSSESTQMVPNIVTVWTTTTTSETQTETIWTTTTTSETQTNTVWTTTTASETVTNTIWTTTTTVTTGTETIFVTTTTTETATETLWTTTTSSETRTEMADVLQTLGATTTTQYISMTSDTSFDKLGLTSRGYVTIYHNGTESTFSIKTANKVSDLINKLQGYGIESELNDGKITITPTQKGVYVLGMSENLANILNVSGDFYTTSLGQDMTESNTYIYDGAIAINNSTTLSQIGVTSGNLVVKKDGVGVSTIAVSESQNMGSFLEDLENAGFKAFCTAGEINIWADGDMYLDSADTASSNAINVLKLSNLNQNYDSTYSNSDSNQLEKLTEVVTEIWQASSEITLQIGTGSDEHSRMTVSTGFTMDNLDRFANIGKKTVSSYDYVSELDDVIKTITAKQTELGAYMNRLESVLDEIAIKYDNLVSSRSTLSDADLADVSSTYIMQQILQQASATLLSVANQTPQLALQLL